MKPGPRTSEFWLAAVVVAAGIVGAVNPAHYLPSVGRTASAWTSGIASAAYAAARAVTKAAHAISAASSSSGSPSAGPPAAPEPAAPPIPTGAAPAAGGA